MKAPQLLLIVFVIVFASFLIVFTSNAPFVIGKGEKEMPLALCPAIVQAKLKENAERLKGTIAKVEKEQAQETAFYDAQIATPEGKLWCVKLLSDGKVLEIDERKEAKGRLVELYERVREWRW
jgi:hypothetical protein